MPGANVTVKIKGDAEILRNFKALAENAPLVLLDAGVQEMEIEVKEMQRRTPVRYGTLRDSIEVMSAELESGRVVTTVGSDVEYAPYVHENLEAFHEIGEAKFIESVIDESEPHLAQRIADRLDLQRMMR